MSEDTDRRRHPRYRSDKRIMVSVLKSGADPSLDSQMFYCDTYDLSAGGFRVLVEKRIPPGSEVEVWLKPRTREEPVILMAETKWCENSEKEGLYWLGVELTGDPAHRLALWQALFSER
jgi:hypothetical protein